MASPEVFTEHAPWTALGPQAVNTYRYPGNRNRKYTLQRKGGGTYRLQLVHEFDQELSTLRRLAVQLHARLHGVEPTCGTEPGSRIKRGPDEFFTTQPPDTDQTRSQDFQELQLPQSLSCQLVLLSDNLLSHVLNPLDRSGVNH